MRHKSVPSLVILFIHLNKIIWKFRTTGYVLLGALLVPACSLIPRDSFTGKDQYLAQIPGVPNARFWLDGTRQELQAFLRNSALQRTISATRRFDVLALSGGAYDGAYSAGVIAGWTESGSRPQFTIVTGVSAGALIAPLAFLGPEYDTKAAEAFNGDLTQVLGDMGGIFTLLGTPDLRRQTLLDLVSRFVDEDLLKHISAEHARGRRLYVITTNLDAQRGVVWDMGAIASSSRPDAVQLFREVLIASAGVPGVFGPTYIEVEANGRRFKEMHVDGGATTQFFVLPDVILATEMGIIAPHAAPANIWIIINNHITPEFQVVESGVLTTASRSFSTLIKNDARGSLLATAEFVGRDRFNLTFIDDSFNAGLRSKYGDEVKPGFDKRYMEALYQYGLNKARSGHLWSHEVPLPGTIARPRKLAGH